MSIKVIAIGNTLMSDDGIGIRILENIKDSLKVHGIDTFIGETDFEYCISVIQDGDYIFIIDASMLGKNPGTITIIPIDEYSNLKNRNFQHSCSFSDLLYIYHKSVNGYIIGIEIEKIYMGIDISKHLHESIQQISAIVYNTILGLIQS